MFNKIEAALNQYEMLNGKTHVIAAVSGGADSMCLLHWLTSNSTHLSITVSAAHMNHMLRGEEAERDLNFVEEQCKILNVKLFKKYSDIRTLAAERKIGLEECGRQERYSFFSELITDEQTVVATAHTASDNAETVLLNIVRGSGIDGLKGIPPVRKSIIRPLIFCSREEIEEYCDKNRVPFVTDSSNLTLDYSRNKIRLSVLPTLRQINPSVENAVNRLSQTAANERSYLRDIFEKEYERCKSEHGLTLSELKKCDRRILPDIIRVALEKRLEVIPEKKHIDLIIKIIHDGHGAVELRKNKSVRISCGELLFDNIIKEEISVSEKFPHTILELNHTIYYNGKKYVFSCEKYDYSTNIDKINKKLLYGRLRCDIISCDTVIRHRESGDFFQPVGRNCTKTVKKLFTELKIPVEERGTRLLIAKGSEVLWIEGIGASQTAVATEPQNPYFVITVEEYENESGYSRNSYK